MKLRPLAWTKLRSAVIAHSLWADVKGGSSGVRVDPEEVVREFRVDKPKLTTSQNKASAGSLEKKKQSRVKHLLDSKRSTNLSIVLSRFKVSNRVVQLSIWCLDEEVLEEEDVAALRTATPTPDEEALLRGHGNTSVSDLGKPEQYLIAVMAIPRLTERLTVWHYMLTFQLKLTDIDQQVDCLRNAIGKVMSSSALVTVLAQLLAMGNFLNEGSFRGGALGVKIGGLATISDCKQTGARKGSRNLSHSLARAVPKECTTLVEEFAVVSDARKVDFKFLSASAEQLKADFSNVTAELTVIQQENYAASATTLSGSLGKPDVLPARLKAFAQNAGEKLESMLLSIGQCRDDLLNLCRFFELPSPKVVAACEEFAAEIFDNLSKFRDTLISALEDNEK